MDALVDSSPEAQFKAQVVKICSEGKASGMQPTGVGSGDF